MADTTFAAEYAAAVSAILPEASLPVDSYSQGTPNGFASVRNLSQSALPLFGNERYGTWAGISSVGTANGSVIGTSFGLGAIALKKSFETTTVPGQFVGLNVVVRGGYHGTPQAGVIAEQGYDASGDITGVIGNVVSSSQSSYAAFSEAVVFSTNNGAFDSTLYGMKVQSGAMQPSAGQKGIGFFAEATNGVLGAAFQASNRKTTYQYGAPGEWGDFLVFNLDNGVRTYVPFRVDGTGQVVLFGAGLVTPKKTIKVNSSGDLEIDNNSGAAIAKFADDGTLTATNVSTTKLFTPLLIVQSSPPASATATGATGTIQWDGSYVYVCTATNTWKRTPLASW